VDAQKLAIKLRHFGYPQSSIDFLYLGFTKGFSTGCGISPSQPYVTNLKSVFQNISVARAKVSAELEAGRIAGPFPHPPFPNYVCSPLGVVPKSTPGKFRLIHHLSFPEGNSVNDGIPEHLSSVTYTKVSDAIQSIKFFGVSCFLAKIDIQWAYRLLPINPEDYHLLGFQLEGFYFNKCLPMGLSSSCLTFEKFSTSLEFIIRKLCPSARVHHLIDDFLFIAPSKEECQSTLETFQNLCGSLRVPLAPEKTVGPSQKLTFLGITLDTINSCASLPEDKVIKSLSYIDCLLSKRSATLRELQQVIGLLNFACQVVVPGRAFLRRTIDLTVGLKQQHYHRRLSEGARSDLQLWKKFIMDFNGQWFFLEDFWCRSDKLHFYTDAAQGVGFGAVFGSKYFYGEWPEGWKSYNIVTLELFPIVLAVMVWGPQLFRKCILFHTDNQALVQIINKQTSKDKATMHLVRNLVSLCLKHNLHFKAVHIPGYQNILADSLSRLQIQKFRLLAPWAAPHPTPIPPVPPSLVCSSQHLNLLQLA
jgi:hypothetical protein